MLIELRRRHNEAKNVHITPSQIAKLAQVRIGDEFCVELGQPVNASVANRVLNAFNSLTGSRLSFNDFQVQINDADLDLHPYVGGLRAR
jgi:hypothetical protein